MLAASGVMYARLLVLLAFFNLPLAASLLPSFGFLAAVAIGGGWWWSRRGNATGKGDQAPVLPRNPLQLEAAAIFGVIFGYVIERGGLRVYHSGDTAWFDGFAQIGARCGEIHAAMLPIGAYAPRWFMRPQHMDPADAVRAFTALGAKRFIAMHWGTFKLTDEDLREPPELLRETWKRENLPDGPLEIPAIGETLLLDRAGAR